MKASKLIEELQKLISEHGDLEVWSNDERYGDYQISDIYLDEKFKKSIISIS